MNPILKSLRRQLPAPRCLALLLTGALLLLIGLLGAVRAQSSWNYSDVSQWLEELKHANYVLVVGADLPLELIADVVAQPAPAPMFPWQPFWSPIFGPQPVQRWGNTVVLLTTNARYAATLPTVRGKLCSRITVRTVETIVGSSAAFGQSLGGVADQNIVRLRLGTPSSLRLTGIDAMHLITQMQPGKLAQNSQNPCG